MRKIIWLDSAINDLVRLRTFIAKNNQKSAIKSSIAIKKAANLLLTTPLAGKPVKNLHPYRDLITRFASGGYVLRYRVDNDFISIVHIRHTREAEVPPSLYL